MSKDDDFGLSIIKGMYDRQCNGQVDLVESFIRATLIIAIQTHFTAPSKRKTYNEKVVGLILNYLQGTVLYLG